MKDRIVKITVNLLAVIVLAAALTGAVFAHNLFGKKAAQDFTDSNSNKIHISDINRENFNLGSKFVSALKDAAYLEQDENAGKSVIVDLVYLLDLLEGQPETAVLQKTLKAVVRGTSNAAQIRSELENASKSYSKRLPPKQKWYFNSGTAVTNLVFNGYFNDDAAIKINLSEIKELVKIAPQETSDDVLVSLNNLTKYLPKAVFAESDYTAVFQSAISLVETINI